MIVTTVYTVYFMAPYFGTRTAHTEEEVRELIAEFPVEGVKRERFQYDRETGRRTLIERSDMTFA